MRFYRPFAIALLLLGAQLSALGSEMAVLRNGFSIRHERREQIGKFTRLYTGDQQGYVDVPTDSIASFEPVEPTPPDPSVVAAPKPAQPEVVVQPAKVNIDQLIRDASGRYRLDPDFVSSVIKAESNFQPKAVSRKGAQGLMQLMPATSVLLGVADPFDPKANIEAGTAYLSQLLDLYNDDPVKALAAYNAGAHRVRQYHGVPPYRETKAYVARIVRDYNKKKQAQGNTASQSKQKSGQQQAAATTPLGSPSAN